MASTFRKCLRCGKAIGPDDARDSDSVYHDCCRFNGDDNKDYVTKDEPLEYRFYRYDFETGERHYIGEDDDAT